MKRILGIAVGGIFLITAAGAFAASAPGNCFNGDTDPSDGCTANCPGDPNNPDCSADDSGCVSNTKNHLKCSQGVGSAFCKLVACVIGCHKKQADARFKGATATAADTAEDTCEGTNTSTDKSCGGKFNAALNKLIAKNICDNQQITGANSEAAVLVGHPSPIPALSLDGMNSGVYCDSASVNGLIGGDDTGWVPASKTDLACADAEGKAAGAAVCCVIKAHAAMNGKFFAGKPYNEESVEETNAKKNGCQDKFNKARDKAQTKGCNVCNNATGWDGQWANADGTVDGANVVAYPCNLGP
jgi:hypothetical protein